MACFTLTGAQRRLLADAIEVGMGEMDDGADYDLLASLVEEITASDAPIEITVMRIEDGMATERFETVDALMADLNDETPRSALLKAEKEIIAKIERSKAEKSND